MTHTLFNPSATDYGRSGDNILRQMRSMGANLALVRDSSKLAAMCASVGMGVVFRAAGDDPAGDPIGKNDPAGFINARFIAAPMAMWIHGTNEVGFSAQLDVYTRELARAAEAHGKRIVAYNAATNQDLRQWQASESTIRWLVERGHVIGVHVYLDGGHDDGGLAPLAWLKSIGAKAFVTEYAYIRSIFDANVGYRAVMDAADYMGWHDDRAPKMASYGFPLFHFSLTHWNDDAEGKRVGFGTEDRPEVDAHFAVLNARYPIQETTPVPDLTPLGQYRLARIPASYVNVRSTPGYTPSGAPVGLDVGDLRVGDVVTLFTPESDGWVYTEGAAKGWVSRQNGAVVFEPVPVPPAPYINGIDISQAQLPSAIDWKAVKAGGHDFAIIRATQGVAEKDTAFVRHIDAALAAGMRVGVYHAFIASLDGAAQADFFHKTIYPYLDRLSFPPAIDVELLNGQSPRTLADRLRAMCLTMEALTEQKPLIYTAPGWWNSYVGSQWDAYFATLPLWVAHWTAAAEPMLPRPWRRGTWALWQWRVDENGIPGYGRRVDVNRQKA